MESHDWVILTIVAVLGFCCYFTRETARTERMEAMGSIIVACASSCEGTMVSALPCECGR